MRLSRIIFAGKLYEAPIEKWSPEGRVKFLDRSWLEPDEVIVIKAVP